MEPRDVLDMPMMMMEMFKESSRGGRGGQDMTMSCLVSLVWAKCVIRVPDHNDKYRSSLTTGSDGLRIHPGGQDMSLILKLSQCKISRSGSLQQLAPESGAIVSCRRSCPGHAADEDEEEEVDEEEEEDEEEEKEAMEKEPHLIQMRLALADISSDPAELCALPGMRGPRQLATFAVAKYFRPGCPFLYGGSPWQA